MLALILPAETASNMTVAARDRQLFALHTTLFGMQAEAVSECPGCKNEMEMAFSVPALLKQAYTAEPAPFAWGEHRINLRLPTTQDLLEVIALPPAVARRQLAARCADAAPSILPDDPQEWDHDLVDLIANHLAEADPVGDVEFAISCPACNWQGNAVFDIADFLTREIEVWVHQLIYDVQLLAGAYGWREKDILRLPAWRRQHYVEALGA